MKNNIIIIILILLSNYSISQVNWPLPPFTVQHEIAGTIGEYRNNSRFHKGTDVSGSGNVYAIEDGTVTNIRNQGTGIEQVRINETWYVHVDATVNIGDPIIAGVTVLGTIISGHVHLEENNRNFLNHVLYPYVDNSNPVIYAYSFRRNGHTRLYNAEVLDEIINIESIQYNVLYGKVDIVINSDDPIGVHHVAPNTISYEIFTNLGISIDGGPVESFNFNLTPDNSNTNNCFGFNTTQSNFNYILTSHPTSNHSDRYFNTKLRIGELANERMNWPNTIIYDAVHPLACHYGDGIYQININVSDVDFNDTPNNTVTNELHIIIDNFRPFIQKVEIRKIPDSSPVYSRTWFWGGSI